MGMGFDIGSILNQYSGGQSGMPRDNVEDHFDQVAQNAPHEELADGLGHAFRSDETPPFSNMVGQMFGQADTHQRAGMLNQLLGAVGPGVLGSLLSRGMGGGGGGMGAMGGLGGLLGQLGGGQPQVRPEHVENLRPEEVEELAAHAERENPGIVDQISRFAAQNPQMVKALGGAALAIALGKMAQRNR